MNKTASVRGRWDDAGCELTARNRLLAMALAIAVYLGVIGAVGILNRWLG